MSEFQILFDNTYAVVVNKPAGWLSVPSRTGKEDPRPCLGISLEKDLKVRLWPVHRLDFEVSGLLVFAKSAEAHRIFSAWFEERLVKKNYEAHTSGEAKLAPSTETLWEDLIVRGKKRSFEAPHGKLSRTLVQCLGETTHAPSGLSSLHWSLMPETGRGHQLRFQLAKRGFPILGDTRYGGHPIDSAGIALRAKSLEFLVESAHREKYGIPARIGS